MAALALAFTYNGTKDRIAQQEEAKTVAVRQALLPAAASFEAVDGSEVYRGVDANGAAVGYGDGQYRQGLWRRCGNQRGCRS